MSTEKLTIGCSRAGSLGNPIPAAEIRAMWQAALDAGVRSFDTANIYAQGDSERHLGRILRDNPALSGIEIITKGGFRHGRKAQVVRVLKPVLRPLMRLRAVGESVRQMRAAIGDQNFDPAFLAEGLNASRARLGLGMVHGFLLHDPDVDILAMAGTGAFLAKLKADGITSFTGVSLRDAEAVPAALRLGSIDILQMPVTAWEAIRKTGLAEEIQGRGIRLYLRQILNRPDGTSVPLQQTLPELVADPVVHSVILGISQRKNLDSVLTILSR